MVVLVYYCTNHMVEGKKKDANYILKYFQGKVEEWDTSHMYTG